MLLLCLYQTLHTLHGFVLVQIWFGDIPNIVGYLMPNPVYAYILDICDL